ncbi:hypothetical protein J6590_105990, partial [Homalodisca vitripennis]
GKEPYRVGLIHKVGVGRGALLYLPYTQSLCRARSPTVSALHTKLVWNVEPYCICLTQSLCRARSSTVSALHTKFV